MDAEPSAVDLLLPDPRAAEPSPVPGISAAEYDAIARNILYFGRLPLRQQLRAIANDIAWERRSRPLVDSGHEG